MKKWGIVGIVAAGILLLLAAVYFLLPVIVPVALPGTVIVPEGKAAIIVPPAESPPEAVKPEVPVVLFIGVTTIPLDLAKSQSVIMNIVITFSEAMDPATVNADTFILKGSNGAVISGMITSDATKKVWTFNPTQQLLFNSVYTVEVTTGAKGVSGNALVENFLWSFTTSYGSSGGGGGSHSTPTPEPETPPVTPPTSCPAVSVDLGTAGDFVILSKSGISTTGTSAVTGDMGVSPIDSTAITGFGLIVDASNTFSTSSLVTGKIYAPDYIGPPSTTEPKLTTAVGNMETAYTTANGLPVCDGATDLGAGHIGGLTLVPGVYKWGTDVDVRVEDGDLTLSGSGVYVFQIAGKLDIASGMKVTLSGGADAKDIYWVVADTTTLGTTSELNGNILDQTNIALLTGATLNGRALAQTAVTLQANAVTLP
jgi:hypothetical protein